MALLRQFAIGANVPLYVMATGYDIDIAPSGIVFNVVYIVVLINVVVTKVHRKKNKNKKSLSALKNHVAKILKRRGGGHWKGKTYF